jgi:hypothetical protein
LHTLLHPALLPYAFCAATIKDNSLVVTLAQRVGQPMGVKFGTPHLLRQILVDKLQNPHLLHS